MVGGGNVTNIECELRDHRVLDRRRGSGLAGSGLVLQNNGGDNLPIAADGAFTFPDAAGGSPYNVTVAGQPSNPTQICTVTNGSGTVGSGNVTNVA